MEKDPKDFTKFVFPLIRKDFREERLKDELRELEELGKLARDGIPEPPAVMPENKCRRTFCYKECAPHPETGGETILCEAHLGEVLRGERRAPPINPYIQPQSYPSGALFYGDYTKDKK